MIHLSCRFDHIGDRVSISAIPENIFRLTGERCVVTDHRLWAFKHNPFVDFMSEDEAAHIPKIDLVPDCRVQDQSEKYIQSRNMLTAAGQTEYMLNALGLSNPPLRHPRLYVYEDERIISNRIVVHTTGSDRAKVGEEAIRFGAGEDDRRVMSDAVIQSILQNYAGYDIVQVGGADDKPLGGNSTNLCGQLDYWEVAKLIAGSARFVGVNSGPMHIANCYPRVEKRIVLQEFPIETLINFRPGDVRHWLFSWLDTSNTYFNRFEHDVGVTFSLTKI